MVKAAKAAAQFVYQIPANIACERAFDCVIGEGQKQVGVDSREWSGAGGKNPTPTRINSLALFNFFFVHVGSLFTDCTNSYVHRLSKSLLDTGRTSSPVPVTTFNLANYCYFLGGMVGIFADAFL